MSINMLLGSLANPGRVCKRFLTSPISSLFFSFCFSRLKFCAAKTSKIIDLSNIDFLSGLSSHSSFQLCIGPGVSITACIKLEACLIINRVSTEPPQEPIENGIKCSAVNWSRQ